VQLALTRQSYKLPAVNPEITLDREVVPLIETIQVPEDANL
jgi:hypothetical protein